MKWHDDATTIIVGSGAGGATFAHSIADGNKKSDLLMIEEGNTPSESAYSLVDALPELYRNSGMTPLVGNPTISFAEGCTIGGSTSINGALMWPTPTTTRLMWKQQRGVHIDFERYFPLIERDLHIGYQNASDANHSSTLLQRATESLDWQGQAVKRAQRNCQNTNRCPTGCPSGAKQSMANTYLKKLQAQTMRLLAGHRVVEIIHKGKQVLGVAVQNGATKQIKHIRCRQCVLAGGAIQTPFLMQKSRLRHRHLGRNLSLNLNLKVPVRFKTDVNAALGTMMTYSVRQFIEDGISIGSSNFNPAILASSLSHYSDLLPQLMRCQNEFAIYLVMVNSRGSGGVRTLLGRPYPYFFIDKSDGTRLQYALDKLIQLLSLVDARTFYPPIHNCLPNGIVRNGSAPPFSRSGFLYDIMSVHASSTCRMDQHDGVTDLKGRVRGFNNLWISDASLLPEMPPVNPQQTIMAFAMHVADAFLNDKST